MGIVVELAQFTTTRKRQPPAIMSMRMNSPLEVLIYIGACGGSIATLMGSLRMAHTHIMAMIGKHHATMMEVAQSKNQKARLELETKVIEEMTKHFETEGFTGKELSSAAQALIFNSGVTLLPEAKKKAPAGKR